MLGEFDLDDPRRHPSPIGVLAPTSVHGSPSSPFNEMHRAKERLANLRRREAALVAELDALREEMAATQDVVESLAATPPKCDPTMWLPDELIEEIFLMLPFESLWSGACERVCRRWERLVESALVKRRKREER